MARTNSGIENVDKRKYVKINKKMRNKKYMTQVLKKSWIFRSFPFYITFYLQFYLGYIDIYCLCGFSALFPSFCWIFRPFVRSTIVMLLSCWKHLFFLQTAIAKRFTSLKTAFLGCFTFCYPFFCYSVLITLNPTKDGIKSSFWYALEVQHALIVVNANQLTRYTSDNNEKKQRNIAHTDQSHTAHERSRVNNVCKPHVRMSLFYRSHCCCCFFLYSLHFCDQKPFHMPKIVAP